jgi:hypothetical protein
MKRFEYKTVEIKPKGTWQLKFDVVEIDKILNEMGSQGWELVAVEDRNVGYGHTGNFFYTFKREI